MSQNPEFRLYDFKVTDDIIIRNKTGKKYFTIQMFGINEEGKTASIKVSNFQPFFYIKVGDDWTEDKVDSFAIQLRQLLAREELEGKFKKYNSRKIKFIDPPLENDHESCSQYLKRCAQKYKPYHFKSVTDISLVKKHKLYGFDNKKMYNFVLIKFCNTSSMNKIKNIWYDRVKDPSSKFGFKQTLKEAIFMGCKTQLYEAKLPPLLRYFHIMNISPSGWIKLQYKKYKTIRNKKTNCDFEYKVDWNNIITLPDKETAVPLKICSYDIEASSSHGDFPVAIKSYKKLAGDIVTHWNKHKEEIGEYNDAEQKMMLKNLIKAAFGFCKREGINIVYSKEEIIESEIDELINNLFMCSVNELLNVYNNNKINENKITNEESGPRQKKLFAKNRNEKRLKYTIVDLLNDNIDSAKKVEMIDIILTGDITPDKNANNEPTNPNFPLLEGDKVTFIGSTFLKAGETEPYLNHGICLRDCSNFEMGESKVEIVSCDHESDVLLEWTKIMNREKPHIVIGYNIFGFDYKFMCDRALENDCFDEFAKIGFNKSKPAKRETKSIKIASGTHNLVYLKMDGIIQVDLYNYFRREVNLGSYKLQDVASHFIGDMVSGIEYNGKYTIIKSRNLMGLQEENYVIFQIIGHSVDDYEKGKKFQVIKLNESKGEFWVKEEIVMPEKGKMRWGLGKDDVSPQDLFRLTNGTCDDRAIIAKYCFQDCNLVHHLLRKNDVLTGMSEIASICSVPIDFIVMRGQGIKLLSFIAKKCKQNNTLMPVIDKAENDGSYEGAIVLPPKTGFYTDIPVAVVDYASLYPSSMISENISHDSKVWTKEYDLEGNLLKESGTKKYDNLPEYQYVDIEYDMYEYQRKDGKKKEEKVLVGKKVCRFAQFPDGKKALMPAILTELLKARKDTRKLIKYKTIITNSGKEYSGLLTEKENTYELLSKNGLEIVNKADVKSIKDTYNDFMKNVFNQRQLGYKVTANSLYGQCGARTSAFYEKDIAASTTATGRKLLTYGKRIIEDVYGDRICETSHGTVKSNATYIYGDTDSVFFAFNLTDLNGKKIVGKKALEITIELAIEAGELATKFLKPPHDLEYEKTFHPFLLLSKKRYVGMLYEINPNKCKRKSMGIVLKRRDNAPVVKDIYGGNIDILMKDGDISKAMKFTKDFLQNIVDGKIDLKKLVISKSLRDFYKNPDSIAHKVLADRMGKRDPGNKPAVGSRIPYVYFQTKKKVKLQGEKIEHPDYMIANNLKPDYTFYITNQIMKPLTQIYALVLEQIPEFKSKVKNFKRRCNMLKRKYKGNDEKCYDEEMKYRNLEVKKIIFDDYLRQANNIKIGQRSLKSFF
jgi:DNA polymerase elongation subunit (family B)